MLVQSVSFPVSCDFLLDKEEKEMYNISVNYASENGNGV